MKLKLEEGRDDCMLKCNFCADSSPKGKCAFVTTGVRAEHCQKAIENMRRILYTGGK